MKMNIMNLIRSNSATILTQMPVDSAAIENRPKIALRGSIFFYTPRPAVLAKADETNCLIVTLIYRGNTYKRKLPASKPYQQPRTINWRWQ
jgi:hypothetical protein